MHVLIVENDLDTREVISFLLTEAGHQVTQTANVGDALRLLRVHRDIQLVISDMHLGGKLSGQQLIDVMRQRRHTGHCILMSGDWDALDQSYPEHMSILRKPCGREELLRAVNHALEQLTSAMRERSAEADAPLLEPSIGLPTAAL
jgi:DNA-binding NtrC family response regulator